MHLIKDENGNLVPHGHEHPHPHEHEHPHEPAHCHEHPHGPKEGHCGSCQGGDCKNETIALLGYMLQHNEQHAAELDQMAENLSKMGLDAAAKTIREGVSDFKKGNMRLGLALTLVKEELK